MRGELFIEDMPIRMVNNMVLVGVEDTFAGFTTKGGIKLVNLTEEETWGDSKEFTISEFVMRYGKVMQLPNVITKGTFNYNTGCELRVGDTVFWSLVSFSQHIPIVYKRNLMLMVDYHEILARKRDNFVVPINGYGIFSPIGEERILLSHRINNEVSDDWVLEVKPEVNVKYDDNARPVSDIWDVGDHVKLLVRHSPYKLEGTINTLLDKKLYACPMNYIICNC